MGKKRWIIAIMGTLLQIALGSVYAWSFFQNPLMQKYGWTNIQVTWIFSLAICFLGLAAAVGGILIKKTGPRILAMTGAILWSSGWIIGAYALHIGSIVILYLGYGIIGGIGLGLAYVTPVSTAAKWFPDKKGFITGMVVMGFGLGALFMSKLLAPFLMQKTGNDLTSVFLYTGLIIAAITLPASSFMSNPSLKKNTEQDKNIQPANIGSTATFIKMWLVFFLSISAGIMFIGLQSPMLQDLLKLSSSTQMLSADMLARYGATLIAISSIFNGLGRFLWGSLSDKIGRVKVFRLILASQAPVFLALIFVKNPWVFSALVCYILLCYGGGFGTMPSFVSDTFGAEKMPFVYGTILTAWSAAGIVGTQLAAFFRDNFADKSGQYTFASAALILLVGFFITLSLKEKAPSPEPKVIMQPSCKTKR